MRTPKPPQRKLQRWRLAHHSTLASNIVLGPVLRLKRVLLEALKEQGVDLNVPPDGPAVRMVDQEIVRQQFYACTPAEGTPAQKTEFRRKRFNRAVDWAEDQLLIAVHEIGLVTYLRLSRPEETKENAGSELMRS